MQETDQVVLEIKDEEQLEGIRTLLELADKEINDLTRRIQFQQKELDSIFKEMAETNTTLSEFVGRRAALQDSRNQFFDLISRYERRKLDGQVQQVQQEQA